MRRIATLALLLLSTPRIADGQTLAEIREQMRTGKKPAASQLGRTSSPCDRTCTVGKVLAFVGGVMFVTGLAFILSSQEGHSPLGGCNDCAPAGEALGTIVMLGGVVTSGVGALTYAVGKLPPTPPPKLALGWTFRF
jgi:hypothetical protein